LFGLTNIPQAFIILNMRTLWRTSSSSAAREEAGAAADSADAGLFRDVALVCLADGIVGLSFGAAAVAGGLPWWVPVALSVLVFAGGSQIAAVGVVLGGGSPVAAVAAGAVLNTRLLPYGLAVADVVRPAAHGGTGGSGTGGSGTGGSGTGGRTGSSGTGGGRTRGSGAGSRTGSTVWDTVRGWLIQIVGAHVITDESVAFALRQADQARRRVAFWTCGIALFAVWNVTVLLGVLAGSAIHDTNSFGLDATFPAVVVALALPALTSRPIRNAAGTGALIAVALTPVLPAGLPLLAALGGLAARRDGWRGRRLEPRNDAGHDRDASGHGESELAESDQGTGGRGTGDLGEDDRTGRAVTAGEVRAGRAGDRR
jgi:predicted branched-subunit amino acid permease